MPRATRANLLWYQGRSWSRGLTRPPQTAFLQVSWGSSPSHCTRLSGVCSASALLPSRETGRGPSGLALPTFTVPAPQVSHCGKPAGCQSSSVTWRALEDSPQTVTSQAHTLTSRPAVPCTAGDEEPLRTGEDDHRTPKLLTVAFPRRSLHTGWQVSLECSEGDRPAGDSRSGNGFHTGNGREAVPLCHGSHAGTLDPTVQALEATPREPLSSPGVLTPTQILAGRPV